MGAPSTPSNTTTTTNTNPWSGAIPYLTGMGGGGGSSGGSSGGSGVIPGAGVDVFRQVLNQAQGGGAGSLGSGNSDPVPIPGPVGKMSGELLPDLGKMMMDSYPESDSMYEAPMASSMMPGSTAMMPGGLFTQLGITEDEKRRLIEQTLPSLLETMKGRMQ